MTAPYIDAGNKPGDGSLRPGGKSLPGLPQTEANLPSTPSKAVEAQKPALSICRDLADGNERVKERGLVYLPKNPGETPSNYSVRLARSVFYNVFGRTIEGLTGLVFAKDPRLSPDVPVLIRGDEETDVEGHWENIDLEGTHGDVFCRSLLQDALTAGHNAILVEFPATGGVQDHADEQHAIRPYWVPIKKDDIVSWRTMNINGRLVLTQLVLKECSMVEDGEYGEKEQTRYRVFRNDNGVVSYRLLEVQENKQVVQIAAGLYPTQVEIPIAEVVTSGRRSLFVSQPPLIDLAYLNIEHYQEYSDLRTAMHMTCVPILHLAGVNATNEDGTPSTVEVGPHSAVKSADYNAKVEYVSHGGGSLELCRTACEDLKSDMGTLGLSMLAPQKRAAETAESKRIDKQGSDSALGVTARGLQDAVERALGFHARYLKQPSGGSIVINRNFDEPVMDAATMAAYADLADKIGLPLKMVLEALQRGGRIPESVDIEALVDEMDANKAASDAARQAEERDRIALLNGQNPALPAKAA